MIGVVAASDKPSALTRYRQKRDPGKTNEPFEAEPLVSAEQPTWLSAFVVHEHAASRRHFDLRLGMHGVLKSFAVPKGPTLDPREKRLAVETEDHPLSYLDYEGIIPKGNYGAGSMIAWDVGQVRFLDKDAEAGLRAGKLDFELRGYKLRGRFALVLTKRGDAKQRQWLLIKKPDAYAREQGSILEEAPESVLSGLTVEGLAGAGERARALAQRALALGGIARAVEARGLTPAACTSEEGPLHAKGWLYELKLDGVRILADKCGDDVVLYYRKGRLGTQHYPELVRALRALPVERALLDGEVVAFDARGKPNFQLLAQRFAAATPADVQLALRAVPVSYFAFDVLALGDYDLRGLRLDARKALLAELVPRRGVIRQLEYVADDGRAMYDFCRAQRLEGVVAKRAASLYREGPRRSPDWVKIKCDREDDFVVVGFTRGTGSRKLGAVDVASYTGERLIYRGKVGSGLDDRTLALLERELAARASKACAAEGELGPAPRGRRFVRPELVINVRYAGFTADGHLRHPVFMGLRADISPHDCTAAPEAAPPEPAEPPALSPAAERPKRAGRLGAGSPAQERHPVGAVKLTNTNKVFWPSAGYTKGDLCAYYDALAPQILPFLRERPVILVRYPDGVEGKSFYQWNVPRGTPSWVKTIHVRWEERGNKEVDLFLIEDRETLLYIANLGCIPLHILAARVGDLSACDFLTVDFDLSGGTFVHAITLARSLLSLLERLGLASYPKTSGQTGLHVLVPLGPGVNFDAACALADLLGKLVAAQHSEIATTERRKEKRGARVYIDTGQTGTTRAIVAPYSVRAHPDARVSAPLSWDEVGFALDPARFTMRTLPQRAASIADPMAGFFEHTPDFEQALAQLAALLPSRAKR
jgi:bifunctional non-homologous end joining protein LigD